MADSLLALLITALAAVPGVTGEYVYRLVLGVDRREKEFRTVCIPRRAWRSDF